MNVEGSVVGWKGVQRLAQRKFCTIKNVRRPAVNHERFFHSIFELNFIMKASIGISFAARNFTVSA